MKLLTVAVMTMALLAGASMVSAEEVTSGLRAGELIGAFYVTKLAGAEDDGVEIGKNLCYRCKNGGRPQVMIFTRSPDTKVLKLVQQLDAAIPANSDKQLCAFVNYLGADEASAKADVKKLAQASMAKHVPFVVPNDFNNGPDGYGIDPQTEVTVILAEGGKVKANHFAASAQNLNVEAVIADLAKILN